MTLIPFIRDSDTQYEIHTMNCAKFIRNKYKLHKVPVQKEKERESERADKRKKRRKQKRKSISRNLPDDISLLLVCIAHFT